MKSLLPTILQRLSEGRPLVLSTIVRVERRAPRGAGAAMVVDDEGRVTGSLSGGCIEPAIIQESAEVLDRGTPRLRTFGITDDQAFDVGLSCGGTVHVLMEPLFPARTTATEGPKGEGDGTGSRAGDGASPSEDPEGDASTARRLLQALAASVENETPAALVSGIGDGEAAPGLAMLVGEEGAMAGTLGTPEKDKEVVAIAREKLGLGLTGTAPLGDGEIFIQSFAPPPRLYIIGAVHPAGALAAAGRFLGFRVIVCDPRSPFATPERLPDAHEIVKEWPDRYLARVSPAPRDAVCVLTHDLKFDVPAIAAALDSSVGYIGAMGSRRTHQRRVEALLEAGVSEEAIERIAAPIGLDIGADTPEEVAVAVVAEIIARRRARAS